ncbi:LuxR C-terminal-related transcriptional regulator [Streptomyces sp. NPDC097619]|uniref:ATP-binding protein n=1 Tax=Streptomyces sp. NPDC097619 TaxID=3157228 RepID=UPI00331EA6B6
MSSARGMRTEGEPRVLTHDGTARTTDDGTARTAPGGDRGDPHTGTEPGAKPGTEHGAKPATKPGPTSHTGTRPGADTGTGTGAGAATAATTGGTGTRAATTSREDGGWDATPARTGLRSLAPLVGRDTELAELTATVLAGRTRMLSLTGPVGVGKSRLAAAVFDAVAQAGVRGRYLDLDTLGTEEAALRLRRIRDTMSGAVSEGDRALLVLDFGLRPPHELTPAVASLADACGRLSILSVASRPLGVYGERPVRLAPLALPEPADTADPDRLARVPAVRLLLSCLRAGRPGFRLTAENSAVVAELCARLDGLPLAVELAASRLKVISPAALLDGLGRSPEALYGTRADTTSRHLTMPDALAHSWSALPADRRALLSRLAVFADTFDAVGVSGVLGLPLPEVHTALGEYVDHSLLLCEEQPDGDMRFRMPSLHRRYARTLLERQEAWTGLEAAHTAHVTTTALELLGALDGPEQRAALDRLGHGHEDLLAALDAHVTAGDGPAAARLAAAAVPYWLLRGEARAAVARLTAARTTPGGGEDPAALAALGAAHLGSGSLAAARDCTEKALALFTTAGDAQGTADTRLTLARVLHEQGDSEAAEPVLFSVRTAYAALGDRHGAATAAALLADVLGTLGRTADGLRLADEAERGGEEHGDARLTAFASLVRGRLLAGGPDAGRALAPAQEALLALHHLGDLPGTGAALLVMAQAHARGHAGTGQAWERAALLSAAAGAVREQVGGLPLSPPPAARDLTAEARTRLGDAAYEKSCRAAGKLSLDEAVGRAVEPVRRPRALPRSAGTELLTAREQEVAALVAEGLTNREVARRLGIAEWTAVNTLRKVMRKLDCSSRVHVAQKILRAQQRTAADHPAEAVR